MHLSLCVFLIFVREGDVTRSTRNKGKLWTRADVVPVGEWDCYFTEAYAKNMRPWQVCSPTEKALFVQHSNGRRLSPQAVGDIVERATVKSGVGRRVSPHTFRHYAELGMVDTRWQLICCVTTRTSVTSRQSWGTRACGARRSTPT